MEIEFPPKLLDLLSNDESLVLKEECHYHFPTVFTNFISSVSSTKYAKGSSTKVIKACSVFIYLGKINLNKDIHMLWYENSIIELSQSTLWQAFKIIARTE